MGLALERIGRCLVNDEPSDYKDMLDPVANAKAVAKIAAGMKAFGRTNRRNNRSTNPKLKLTDYLGKGGRVRNSRT